jgi:hypothetical protein
MLNKNDLINAFLDGSTKGKGSNLEIFIGTARNGKKYVTLINYSTIIAIRTDSGYIILNSDKHSRTTSTNQNLIRRKMSINYLYEATADDINDTLEELTKQEAAGNYKHPQEIKRLIENKKKLKGIFIK